MSVRQGERIARLLESGQLPWNRQWDGDAAVVPENGPALVRLPNGLHLTLLSPRRSQLSQLSRLWKEGLELRGQRSEEAADRPDEDDGLAFEQEALSPEARGPQEPKIVLIVSARRDQEWVGRLRPRLVTPGLELDVQVRDYDSFRQEFETDDRGIWDRVVLALFLISPDFLAGRLPGRREPWAILEAAEARGLPLTWFLLEPCDWQRSPIARFQALHDVHRPLARLSEEELETTLQDAALSVYRLLKPHLWSQEIDVSALASTAFVTDRSVTNGSSIAFLAEFEGASLLVGGDAWPEVLERSIRELLAQRALQRLPVGAFVVPHGGSAQNLSRELLALIQCDRYLFSTNGARFRHPSRETIARILTYGRSRSDAPLTLVFNYRTEWTEVWASPTLQQRYSYKAIYPEQEPGIKVQI